MVGALIAALSLDGCSRLSLVTETFEKSIENTLVEAGKQPEQIIILKVVQLSEIMDVRHSVFIIGPGGSGKTEVWKTLAQTWTNTGRKTTVKDISPKSVTTNELYGYRYARVAEARHVYLSYSLVYRFCTHCCCTTLTLSLFRSSNPTTKEYTDGLFSKIMRDLKNVENTDPKWIVLDGDIDPDWIESLNTVMDDNRVLTLPSNERIPLLGHMRLIFEIGHLRHATPATVSRAGILFINESDLGWGPYHLSWINNRSNVGETSNLTVLFDKYVGNALEFVNKNLKHAVPVSNFAMVQTLCSLLDGLLIPDNIPAGRCVPTHLVAVARAGV